MAQPDDAPTNNTTPVDPHQALSDMEKWQFVGKTILDQNENLPIKDLKREDVQTLLNINCTLQDLLAKAEGIDPEKSGIKPETFAATRDKAAEVEERISKFVAGLEIMYKCLPEKQKNPGPEALNFNQPDSSQNPVRKAIDQLRAQGLNPTAPITVGGRIGA